MSTLSTATEIASSVYLPCILFVQIVTTHGILRMLIHDLIDSESEVRSKMKILSNSPEQTNALGVLLGEVCNQGDVILLEGDLGTGKTCFVQGLAKGLGFNGPVTSPTFVLIAEYRGRIFLYHMDLYRLADGLVKFDLGLDEYFYADGVTVVEWPEYGGEAIPSEYMRLRFWHEGPETRSIECEYVGSTSSGTYNEFREAVHASGEGFIVDQN